MEHGQAHGGHRGAARYTGSGNRSATLDNIATDIALVVTRPGSGRTQIYLDGVLVATVNLARSSRRPTASSSTSGISRRSGRTRRGPTVGDGRVELDAFMALR